MAASWGLPRKQSLQETAGTPQPHSVSLWGHPWFSAQHGAVLCYTDPTDAKSGLIRKDPEAGKDGGQEKRARQRVRWLDGITLRLNGRGFEQALGDGEGQGGRMCCSPRGHRESDAMEQLNSSCI